MVRKRLENSLERFTATVRPFARPISQGVQPGCSAPFLPVNKKGGSKEPETCASIDLLRWRWRGGGRCRVGLLSLTGGWGGCGSGRVGALHFVMLVFRSGVGRLRSRGRRSLRSRGRGALRLSRGWILGGRRGAGLGSALRHYRQGQGEYNERSQDDSK